METSPNEHNITDLCSQQYSYDELIKIANYEGDIHQYNGIYPVECIRQNNSVFRVAYLGKAHVAILFFDQGGNKTFGRVFQLSPPLREFNSIGGNTLIDIMNIDPAGDYTFLYTGRNDYTVSNHYTSDGYMITLTYNSENTVVDVHVELI